MPLAYTGLCLRPFSALEFDNSTQVHCSGSRAKSGFDAHGIPADRNPAHPAALIFWLAALTQTFLWVLVPSIFYSAPPGEVADVVAVGRELTFGASHGPQLAYWLAEFALRATGGHIFGIYLLSQICILVAYWAVFQFGRAIIGDRHAVLAVLLMTGISVFTIGSPDFGPDILMMPLWALTLLHFWRATSENRELYWLAVGLDICLMLLTSHLALVLVAALLVFIAMYPRARANIARRAHSWLES